VPTSLSDPHVTRAVIGSGLYLSVLGLFALAIGQIIRHTAGAITTVIALVLVLVPLAGLLPGNLGKHVSAYLPTNAGQQIIQIYPKNQILTAWQGFGVFAIWTAVLLAVAAFFLVERDA
jgi:ABC-type transport system involved in multi-copper enzyme maturation permease subunit